MFFEEMTKGQFMGKFPQDARRVEELRTIAPHLGYYVMLLNDHVALVPDDDSAHGYEEIKWSAKTADELYARLAERAKILHSIYDGHYRRLFQVVEQTRCKLEIEQFYVTLKVSGIDKLIFDFDLAGRKKCAREISGLTSIAHFGLY